MGLFKVLRQSRPPHPQDTAKTPLPDRPGKAWGGAGLTRFDKVGLMKVLPAEARQEPRPTGKRALGRVTGRKPRG